MTQEPVKFAQPSANLSQGSSLDSGSGPTLAANNLYNALNLYIEPREFSLCITRTKHLMRVSIQILF
jgi:hypothetical protein